MKSVKIFVLSLITVTAVSCGGSSESGNQSSEAQALVVRAKDSMEKGDYENCLILLDSVARNYKTDTAAIRQVINLRPVAIEHVTQQQMATNDSLIACGEARVSELRKMMREVSLPNAGSYFVANKAYNQDFMTSNGVSARADEYGFFYLVSALQSPDIKYTSISVNSSDSSASTPSVAMDNSRNYSRDGARIITFTTAESMPIGQLVASNRAQTYSLVFNGQPSKTIPLSKDQVEAIAQTFEYSQAVDSLRKAYLNRERLMRRLEVARQQQEKHDINSANNN